MSDIAIKETSKPEPYVWQALKNSIYPGAKDDSIMMAVSYCRAKGLDVLLNPVHIVPMPIKGVYRDVIMPGIGLYRTQAARSGCYAGISEPEYGPDINADLDGVKITYPKWCKITVKKIIQGQIVEFTAKEYWLENYATKKHPITKKETKTPHPMWYKRPYGQLGKCTESQALKKAFPELIGNQPTAEEMEGKTFAEIDNEVINITPKAQTLNSRLDTLLNVQSPSTIPILENNIDEDLGYNGIVIENMSELERLIETYNVPKELTDKWCEKAGVFSVKDIKKEEIIKPCIEYIEKKYVNMNDYQ